MTYSLEDIELMISNLPLHRIVQNLDEHFPPQRKHIKAQAKHLPFQTRPRKIINSLIQHFQRNPREIEEKSWINSGVPYFLWDVSQFSNENDVKNLLEIPNIKKLLILDQIPR